MEASSDQIKTRQCTKCTYTKRLQAFVGEREVCRLCWLYVPESEKKLLIHRAQNASAKKFNEIPYPRTRK